MATKKKTKKSCVLKPGYKYKKGGKIVKAKAKTKKSCGCKK
jgi:hypothetical protein